MHTVVIIAEVIIAWLALDIILIAPFAIANSRRHRINQLQQQPRKGETHGSGLGFHVQHGNSSK